MKTIEEEFPSARELYNPDDLRGKYADLRARAVEMEKENAEWKRRIIPFLAVHAANYGLDHYGMGCMHFTHYDMLAEAGGRVDDFKRCGDSSARP